MKFDYVILCAVALGTIIGCVIPGEVVDNSARALYKYNVPIENINTHANIMRLTWTKFDEGNYDALDMSKLEWIVKDTEVTCDSSHN